MERRSQARAQAWLVDKNPDLTLRPNEICVLTGVPQR
jgi:hypothetical protein